MSSDSFLFYKFSNRKTFYYIQINGVMAQLQSALPSFRCLEYKKENMKAIIDKLSHKLLKIKIDVHNKRTSIIGLQLFPIRFIS